MRDITRRKALKLTTIGGASWLLPSWEIRKSVPHIFSLSFDDGFKASSIKTAAIYDKFLLKACFNVVATGHLPNFEQPDKWQVTPKGDFMLWNELQSRGHEIMPHGYAHINHTEVPLAEAIGLISKCLDYFSEHLHNFNPQKAIYNLPYNASYPELENYLLTRVRALRTAGPGINPIPQHAPGKLTCAAGGPENTEAHLDAEIEQLLQRPQGWLIYNAHGLDGEGWGPMRASYLENLLERLSKIDSLAILPVGAALEIMKE